jgi:metallophosphoesterase superfamily enzyme
MIEPDFVNVSVGGHEHPTLMLRNGEIESRKISGNSLSPTLDFH